MTTPDFNPAQSPADPSKPVSATPAPQEADYLFLRRTSAVSSALLWTLGGLLAFGFAVAGGIIALTSHVDQFAMQAMTTLPILLGIGSLSAAWALGHTPNQVSVGPEGLAVEGRKGKKIYPWSEIGYASIKPTLLNNSRQLVVCNTAGKTIVKISDGFSQFDLLVDMVNQRLAAKGDDTVDRLRIRKAKRTAIFTAGVAVVMLGVTGSVAWMTHEDQRAARLLAESAVPGEADVVDRRLAPDGYTCRLEYRITTPEGLSATHNAEVTRPCWDRLEGVKKVPVLYVPSEPSISRLAEGEVVEKDFTKQPLAAYGLCAAMVCLCLFLLVGAALQWHGWDIDFDSKTGKISVKRFGTGR